MRSTAGWQTRWLGLVEQLRLVPDVGARARLIDDLRQGEGPRIVAFANAHALNMAAADQAFHRSLAESDILLRDGVGVSILLKVLGRRSGLNMNGTDLIPEILRGFSGKRVALLGTDEATLATASDECTRRFGVDVVATLDGFRPEREYADVVDRARPDLVVLGMGMPKQEKVAGLLADRSAPGTVIVCGGAILDFLGGKVARAPDVLRKVHLEWLYRLALEPRRLFVRYVIGNPLFLARSVALGVARGR